MIAPPSRFCKASRHREVRGIQFFRGIYATGMEKTDGAKDRQNVRMFRMRQHSDDLGWEVSFVRSLGIAGRPGSAAHAFVGSREFGPCDECRRRAFPGKDFFRDRRIRPGSRRGIRSWKRVASRRAARNRKVDAASAGQRLSCPFWGESIVYLRRGVDVPGGVAGPKAERGGKRTRRDRRYRSCVGARIYARARICRRRQRSGDAGGGGRLAGNAEPGAGGRVPRAGRGRNTKYPSFSSDISRKRGVSRGRCFWSTWWMSCFPFPERNIRRTGHCGRRRTDSEARTRWPFSR